MTLMDLLWRLGLALGAGALVGLQRELADKRLGGIRTFPLIALLGAVAAVLGETFGGWIVAAGLIAVAALTVVGNWIKLAHGPPDPGLTTEVAMVLVYVLGAAMTTIDPVAVLVVTGAVAVLLQLKAPLHRMVDRLGDADARAIMQFVLISLVILPLLPNRTFGPYQVLNPREIWWMVTLIVGIGLAGYLAYRFLGERAGTLLGGVLGGLVSSTATTVGYSRRASAQPALSPLAAVVVVIASSVVFVRVAIELVSVAPNVVSVTLPPLVAMAAWMALVAWIAYRRHRPAKTKPENDDDSELELGNPSELGTALLFGGLYALVLLAVAAAQDLLGERGLYAVAVLSGLTDMDAITLSTARRMTTGDLEPTLGWRLILVASLSNLAFKLAVVAVVGPRRLLSRLAGLFAIAGAGGLVILFVWPG